QSAAISIPGETAHFLAYWDINQDSRNLRLDKRSTLQPTTKIITDSGSVYELLGTLKDEHSEQLLREHQVSEYGKKVLGKGSQATVRLARRLDRSGNPGPMVAVKKTPHIQIVR